MNDMGAKASYGAGVVMLAARSGFGGWEGLLGCVNVDRWCLFCFLRCYLGVKNHTASLWQLHFLNGKEGIILRFAFPGIPQSS